MAIENIGLVAVTEHAAKQVAIKHGGKIKAAAGTKYLLQVENSDVAPENVTVKRDGKDLQVFFEGSDKPDLTIQDFFAEGMDSQLYGVAEDGQLYAYVRTDGEGFYGELQLADGESAPIALGGDSLGDGAVYLWHSFDDSAGFVVWPWLAGLAGIGAAAAIAGHHGGGGGDKHHAAPVAPVTPEKATSPSPSIIKVMDDVGPIQGKLANGDVTDDARPTVTGTGVPGALIHIYDNGSEIGSATVDKDGNWSFTPTSDLTDGEHQFSATQEVPGQNPSPPVDVLDFVVDTTPPAAPTATIVGGIEDGGDVLSPTNTPTVNGTGEPGDTITVEFPTGEKITTTVDPDGNWSVTPTQPLPEGPVDIVVTEQDPAGNTSTGVLPVVIDTVAPNAPQLWLDPASDSGIKGDNITNQTEPTINGKAEPNSEVTVTIKETGEVIQVKADGNGDWSVVPSKPLPEGPVHIDAVATDAAGHTGQPGSLDLIIDTTAPAAPVIVSVFDAAGDVTGNLNPGDITDDTRPTVSGIAEANSVVALYDNGMLIGSTTADAFGNWSFVPTDALSNGGHDLTATSIDAAGNVSQPSNEFGFTVETGVPSAPAITHVIDDVGSITGDISQGGVTDDTRPEIQGTADANAKVTVYIDGVAAGTTTADANGNWTFTPASDLAEGPHDIAASAINAAGNVSPISDAWPIVVDTTAPAQPTIDSIYDDVGSIQGDVANGGVTDDSQPTLSGKAEAGSLVTVYDNGVELGSVTADASGNWSFTPSTPISEGPHAFTVDATDAAGNTSVPSDIYGITTDYTAPANTGLVITDDVGAVTGALSDGDTTDDNQPTFSGEAEPGSTVIVYDNGTPIGSVTADASGNWSFTPADPISDGPHDFTTEVVDGAGNSSGQSDPTHIIIDTSGVSVAITHVIDDVGSITGDITNGGVTDDARPEFQGTGKPDSIVTIQDGGTVLGSTVVDSSGNWSFTPSSDLADGEHSISVTAVDKTGTVSDPVSFDLTVDTAAPTQPTIDSIYDDVGSIQGDLTNGGVTDDSQPTLSGKAEAGSTVTVYDNGVEMGSVTADASGNWTFTPAAPISEGPHDFTVTATDAAGNTSEPSDVFNIVTDYTAPAQPTIDSIYDDVGSIQGEVANGGVTDDSQPTLSGKAEAGSIVTVYDNGVELGSVTADASGNWSFTPADPISEGPHAFTVDATDAAGNTSVPSDAYGITTDYTAPSNTGLVITDDVGSITGALSDGDTTDDNQPTFGGEAEPGSTVIVYDNGTPIGSVTADASGTWSFTPADPLVDGPHDFTTEVVDGAGNSSGQSDPTHIVIDTVAPAQPTIDSIYDDVGSIQGEVANGGVTDDSQPTLSGKAEAGSIVTVYDNGVELGSVTADASGNWSFTPADPISEGPHAFTVDATDAAGNTSVPSDAYGITTDYTAPSNTGLVITDDVGSITGALSDGDTTDDNQPTFGGEAEPGSTVIVYDNGEALGSVTADASGNWSFTPADPLADGPHDFTTEVVDGAGNSSGQSEPTHIIIDTVAPAQPTIDSIYDDVGSIQGEVANGGVTDDSQPTLSGKAEAGSTVTIYDNGVEMGTATADASGNWNFTPAAPISEGPHDFSVTATDAAGNTSVPSDPYGITTDYTAPANTGLVITDDVGAITGALSDGDTTDDNQPTFSGEAEPGSTVIVYDNGTPIGSVTADASGTWSFTPADPLVDGPHDFTTEVVDGAGNSSGQGDPTHIIIDTSGVSVAITHVIDDVGSITGDITNGGVTDDARPEFQGTGKVDSIVTIKDGDTVLGSTVVDSSGNWSFTPSSDLADGEHSISVTAVDKTGTVSDPVSFDLTVDTTAPAQPTIDSIYDDVGSIQGEVANGGVTDDSQPTLSGKAEAGSIVTVYDNGVELGSVTADASGNWSFTPADPISEGPHAFTVDATDAAGNTSVPSDTYGITTDYTAPANTGLVITDDVGSITGQLSDGDTTDDNQPTFSGEAEPGSTVIVYDNGTPIGSVTADASGTWSFTPADPLVDGPHDFTTEVVDGAGNSSGQSDPTHIIIDTVAPAQPTIDSIYDDVGAIQGEVANGGVTDDSQPTLSGKAEAGSLVTVYDNGVELGSVTADASGNWSFTPETPISEGPHDFSVTATDTAGNTSVPSDAYGITTDYTAPANTGLVITDDVGAITGALSDGDTTDDNQPTFSGEAEPGSTVIVYDNGTPIGSVTADASGTWSFTPADPLVDGPHDFTTEVVDGAGNSSGQSDPTHIIIDTVAPAQPTIDSIYDDVGSIQGELVNGGVTDDSQPTLSGKAEAGSIVTVYDNGTTLGSVTADASGNWSFTPSAPISEGPHAFTVDATDAAGNTSVPSDPYGITTDYTAPANTGFVITDDVGAITGALSDGDTTDDNQPTFSGEAEPGSTVIVYDNGTPIGSVTADASGSWSFTPADPLVDGPHDFTTEVVDGAGNSSGQGEPTHIIIDTVAPAQPTIDSIYDDVGSIQGEVANGGVTDDSQPTLSGKAEAGSIVTVYDNGTALGSVTADASGNWSFTPETPISEGPHAFTVDATDAAGNTSVPSDAYGITTDYTAPANTGFVITDDVGAVTGALSDGDSTDDNQPTFSGEAEPGSTVIVYDNGTPIGSVTADASGTWSFTPADPISDGPHDFTTEVVDGAGNSSGQSDPTHIIIDTVAPAQPTIDSIYDDVGSIQGEVANGGVTDDSQPTLSGKAEAGSVVTVYDNGTALGSVTADASGNWSFTPSAPISEGPHAFTVDATDAAGNTSVPSDAYGITTDYTAPANTGLVITDDVGAVTGALSDGDTTDDNQPTFSGEAEPGSTVIVYDNGTPIGSVTADASGTWSFTPADPISDGPHDFSTEVVDGAGNSSGQSDPTHIIIDTSGVSVAITHVIDDVGSITGDITSGGVTDDTRPEIQGTGKPDSIVTIQDGGTVLGSAVVGSDGTWSFTPTSDLEEGEHNLSVTAVDKTGTVSDPATFSFTVDTTAPAQPTIDSIYDDVGSIQGEVANGGVTDDSQPTLSGKAEAGSLVTVYDNGTALGSVAADASGNWSFTPSAPISEGPHAFTVDATDAAGNTSVPSDAYGITTDYTAPANTGFVITDDVGAITGQLHDGDSTDDNQPTFNGEAEPGSTVIVYDNGEALGSVTADASGNWSFTPADPLVDGPHDFTTEVVDGVGNSSGQSDPTHIIIDTVAPAQPTIDSVYDDFGSIQGEVANGGMTDDSQPTLSGKAEAGSVVTVYDNGTALGSVTADASGNWSFTPAAPISEGPHAFTVDATDAAGNTSVPSDTYGITTDYTGPQSTDTQLIINDVTSDNSINAVEASGDVAVSGKVTGEFTVGDVVSFKLNGTAYSAAVAADGTWSVNVPGSALVSDTTSSINATLVAHDAVGNAGTITASHPYEVSLNVVTITSMSKDSAINLAHSTDFITSDGSAGRGVFGALQQALTGSQKVQVSFDNGSTWVDAVTSGTNWAAVDTAAHAGNWSIQARVVDNGELQSLVASQAVTYLGSLGNGPTITSLPDSASTYTAAKAAVGSAMSVSLAGTLAGAGDTLHVIWGDTTYDHVLTAAEISSGNVSLTVPSSVTSLQGVAQNFKVYAQVVTQEGQISTPSTAIQMTGASASTAVTGQNYIDHMWETYFDDGVASTTTWSGHQAFNNSAFTGGTTLAGYHSTTGAFTISGNATKTAGGGGAWPLANNGCMLVADSKVATATFDDPRSSITLSLTGIENSGTNHAVVQVYDVNGTLLDTVNVYNPTASKTAQLVTYDAGSDIIGRVDITGDSGGTVVLDIASSKMPVVTSFDVISMSIDPTAYFAQDTAHVHGGAGVDTLKLTGANQVLDLRSLTGDSDAAKISSIEKFDITGTGNNTLKISLNDVLHLGETDLFQKDGKVQVMVDGDAGDTVQLYGLHDHGAITGTWQDAGTTTIGGSTYHVYSYSSLDAEVLVKQAVATTVV